MTPKTSFHPAVDRWDTLRANLDAESQFHVLLLMSLFPGDSPARLAKLLTITDLDTELRARTIRFQAEREHMEAEIAKRRARLHEDLKPFLTKA